MGPPRSHPGYPRADRGCPVSATDAARLLLARLARAGITHLVICPGSRSAPLAYAAADSSGLAIHVETDERVAAFLALGLGKAGMPAAVVTTSGTAVANLHPAVLEAYHSGVPLVALSADRPARLRGRGANQTTTQPGMLAPGLRAELDIDQDEVLSSAHLIDGVLAHALRGPVHINICFDDPLVPDEHLPLDLEVGTMQSPEAGEAPVELDDKKTVIVAGASGPHHASLGRMAGEGTPIIAEPTAREIALNSVVPAGGSVLAGFEDQIERVIVTGHPTLTRPVSRLISRADIEVIAVADDPVPTNLSGRAQILPVMPRLAGDEQWLAAWQEAGQGAWDRGARSLVGLDSLSIGHLLAGDEGRWMYGASSIIRDIFTFSRRSGGTRFANRGLAGIDGTISTARGIAHGGPTRVVMGDLTFLHDLGSLVPTTGEDLPDLDILVLDDHGGGIFSGLEHGQSSHAHVFDRMFRTEKDLDVLKVAEAAGWEGVEVTSIEHLAELLSTPVSHRVMRASWRYSAEEVRSKRASLAEAMAVQ